ncbi:phage portal protein [Salmonella enterica subsp. enterica serovar Lome]|nr:phage portal protein [Salmonella enterica subsp. enterica serovar Enteritidis]EBY8830934.1 phage portal protein [Salmonella enterica subsp. enterica serovar Schwarzengrund]EEK5733414.1 phage portal protein [Salmonella enterica]ELD7744710.1 phage portal protein [Salmonella enterica subsp. enterica serovar Lome]EBZ9544567.1 phage portal protein [Salmonella enterica subsp. enterica serovar Enteritidis]
MKWNPLGRQKKSPKNQKNNDFNPITPVSYSVASAVYNGNKSKAAVSALGADAGWFPIIRESYAGAWQQGVTVSKETVLAFYAIFSCISLISSDIAKMPIRLMAEGSDGIGIEQKSGDVVLLLRRPNSFQNRIQFFENWMVSKLTRGNTYVLKVRNSKGKVIQLRILDPDRCRPLVSPDGAVFYEIAADNIAGLQEQVTVPAREIIHDRFNCLFHPLVGLPPLYACSMAGMQGQHIQQNSANFFKNGGKPSGVIKVPTAITEAKAKEVKANWDTSYGGENSGKTALLGGGADYVPISMTAVDAQTVEQLKMTGEIACAVYHVPPYKAGVGEAPATDNIEALEQQYYSQCLQIHIESIELLLDEGLDVGNDSNVEFSVDSLLRMDTERRYAAYAKGVGCGVLAPNEARRRENLVPVPGGAYPYLQQQNFSLEALSRRDSQADPFSKTATEPAPPAKAALSVVEKAFVKTSLRGIIQNG